MPLSLLLYCLCAAIRQRFSNRTLYLRGMIGNMIADACSGS